MVAKSLKVKKVDRLNNLFPNSLIVQFTNNLQLFSSLTPDYKFRLVAVGVELCSVAVASIEIYLLPQIFISSL